MASSTGASPRLWKWMKRAVLPDSEANCWVVRRERASLGKKGSGHLICWSLVLSSMLSSADEPRPKTKKSRECRFCTWRPLTVWFGWYRLCMGCGRGASVVFQTSSDLSRIKRLKINFRLSKVFHPKVVNWNGIFGPLPCRGIRMAMSVHRLSTGMEDRVGGKPATSHGARSPIAKRVRCGMLNWKCRVSILAVLLFWPEKRVQVAASVWTRTIIESLNIM